MSEILVPEVQERQGYIVARLGNIVVCDFFVKEGLGPEIKVVEREYVECGDPRLKIGETVSVDGNT